MFTSRLDRLQVIQAHEEALIENRQLTIICWMGNSINAWKSYPQMVCDAVLLSN